MISAIQNATVMGMYVNGSVKIANAVSHDLDLTMAVRDTTNKDNAGWQTGLGGLKSWTCSAEAMFDPSANYTFDQLFALFDARTAITVYLSSAQTGEKKYSGSALITSLKKGMPNEENTTFSVSFQGTGALTETII
jgi:predicted secreted protein